MEDSTNSDGSCFQPLTYELALGSNCDGIYSPADFQINSVSKQITVTAVTPMPLNTLCLKATTKGSVTAIQKLNVEICGDESISYENDDTMVNDFTFGRSEVSQIRTIDLATLGFTFASSRKNCPIRFKLV